MEAILKFIEKNNVTSIIDIGANVGRFSSIVRHYFPQTELFMIEANPYCDNLLSRLDIPYEIVCLSDEEKEVKFYVEDENLIGTGASYYLENTRYYSRQNYMRTKTKLLDNIISERYNDKSFDMIKLDTQGSEIDIMKGGLKTVDRARFVLVELSLIEYNLGAPLKDIVVDFMQTLGFKPLELVENHVVEGVLVQEDWIFAK
jgi:FkbM family methyltransferase